MRNKKYFLILSKQQQIRFGHMINPDFVDVVEPHIFNVDDDPLREFIQLTKELEPEKKFKKDHPFSKFMKNNKKHR